MRFFHFSFFFFFNDTATTEIYTLSLHDALPIFRILARALAAWYRDGSEHLLKRYSDICLRRAWRAQHLDRKSTRLNSSHQIISYAVFCLKKKNNNETTCRSS